MSSGLRLVTNCSSTITSASTQCAPALLRSDLSEGHEVIVRPHTAPALDQRPWQMAAMGLRSSTSASRTEPRHDPYADDRDSSRRLEAAGHQTLLELPNSVAHRPQLPFPTPSCSIPSPYRS